MAGPQRHKQEAPAAGPTCKWVVISVLLAVHLFLAATSVLNKSNTYDEAIHLTAGYTYWKDNTYLFQPENGNFPQRWAALPLLMLGLNPPPSGNDVWAVAPAFFYSSGNDPEKMLYLGRLMIILLSLPLAFVLYDWSRELFGFRGAAVSLGLYAFSPTILAHARLTTSDMATALFFVLSVRMVWLLIHRVTPAALLGTGAAVGGLLLSKMSAVLIVPVAVLLCFLRLARNAPLTVGIGRVREIRSRAGQAALFAGSGLVVATMALVIIWGGYGFRFSAAKVPDQAHGLSFYHWEKTLSGTGCLKPVIVLMRDHRLLPEAYLYGFSYVLDNARMRSAFLKGRYSTTGWWYFFPFSFAVKTPLVTLLLLFLTAVILIRHGNRERFYALAPLILLAVIYGSVAMSSNINIGHRHILLIYPVCFILAGAAGQYLFAKRRTAIFGGLLAICFLLESLSIWPHYLAFFNAAAGGPGRGHRLLVDSSLDWGQDLPGVKKWMDRHHQAADDRRRYYLAYFGTADPAYFGIPAIMKQDMLNFRTTLEPGYYCISATTLQQVYGITGGWRSDDEAAYQRSRKIVSAYLQTEDDPLARAGMLDHLDDEANLTDILERYPKLRLARLCHYLRTREPDDMVGYSILIYDLSPEELNRALDTLP